MNMNSKRCYIDSETVSRHISFDRSNKEWVYEPRATKKTMKDKQAEGVAYIWNILQDENIALMVDEVGMGKTIQALGVCSLLWKLTPDASVLIIAPREAVALNWINEYKVFIDSHYKKNDDIVKTSIGEKYVYEPVFCRNLYELKEKVAEGWCRVFVAKTTSFSHLKLDNVSGNTKREKAGNAACKLRDAIKRTINQFDLLIVDEAHYFRNKDGDSQRAGAADVFFHGLAKNVLLMTATPNHSDPKNVQSMVSYFDGPENNLSRLNSVEILQKIGMRRFRILSEKNPKIKYQYRNEEAPKARFTDDISGEFFFACYQKLLVEKFLSAREEGKKLKAKDAEKGRIFYGYLEGFEFIPDRKKDKPPIEYDNSDAEDDEGESEADGKSTDFKSSYDTEILLKLSEAYRKMHDNEIPPHPKYDKLVNEISPKSETYWQNVNEKELVFVRRIPSSREIAKRIIKKYDEVLAKKISRALYGAEGQSLNIHRANA